MRLEQWQACMLGTESPLVLATLKDWAKDRDALNALLERQETHINHQQVQLQEIRELLK